MTIDVTGADGAAAAKRTLGALDQVKEIEEVQGPDGITRLIVFPGDPQALLIEDVSQVAAENNWPVRTLFAEPGRLDDVFRELTTPDTVAGKERS